MNAWKTKLATALLGAALLGSALSTSSASAQSSEGSGGVLVVGDSLEVLASPYLQQYLPGVQVTVNAIGGYNSFQIFDLFQQSYDPSDSVIVFDAGTNDDPEYPEILAGNLAKAAAIAGPNRCFVVPTIHGYVVNGVNNDGKNNVVESFAASRPGTQVPDWAGFEAAHPELMQSDGLHPIAEGADARAQLIAEGVRACLASAPTTFSSAPGGGPLATTGAPLAPARPRFPPAERRGRSRALAARLVTTEVARHLATLVSREAPTMQAVLVAGLLSPGSPARG